MVLLVKHPTQETGEIWGQSLGCKDSSGGGHGNPLQYSCLENLRGQRSPAGYSPQGHKELGVTEATQHTCTQGRLGNEDM